MKNKVFEGVATALITPFTETGVDYSAFERLVEWQTESGVAALVVAGTTGEAPTLTDHEWEELCRVALGASGGRAKVIIGCGSNSTAAAAGRVKRAYSLGADAALAVTPYYNKASNEGLVSHYRALCGAADLPVIAYNVPSRTGVDLGVEALEDLVAIKNFAGIKEASGSVARSAWLLSKFGDELPVYSGSDEVNFPILSIGGSGMISVLSNVFPAECVGLWLAASSGDISRARELSAVFYPFVAALFSVVNPIPVKTVMAHLGYCDEIFRLPLCAMGNEKREKLFREYEMAKSGSQRILHK